MVQVASQNTSAAINYRYTPHVVSIDPPAGLENIDFTLYGANLNTLNCTDIEFGGNACPANNAIITPIANGLFSVTGCKTPSWPVGNQEVSERGRLVSALAKLWCDAAPVCDCDCVRRDE